MFTRFEVTVYPTEAVIEELAHRIERAYRLRRPCWSGNCSTQRVWAVAARVLWGVHGHDPVMPPDPELFVAAQSEDATFPNPWDELTREESADRYRRCVRTIVRALRSELAHEVKLAEKLIESGRRADQVLRSPSARLSPLSRFIVAHRSGREKLARALTRDAADQHWSCPLYREASRQLLPAGVYPVPAAFFGGAEAFDEPRRRPSRVHLN